MSESAAAGAGSAVPGTDALEAIAVDVVTEGARAIQSSSGKVREVGTKSSPTDPVTALDLAVEGIVRKALARRTPGASILGEEGGDSVGPSPLGWVLDPIDGTVNLTYDLPVIGVSLAATLDGKVVAGAVFDVMRDEVFSAAAGRGARRGGAAIVPSAAPGLAQALVATGFAYTPEGRAAEAATFGRVLPEARDIRCFGSAALHLCWVACGRLDAFYERGLERWDYAAGALIAREAGARVQAPTRQNGRLLVAASPRVFEPLLALIT